MRDRAGSADSTGRVSRYRLLDLERLRVRGRYLRRFWLRWHMTLILVATFAVVAGRFAVYVAPGTRTLGEILMLYR